MRYSLDNSVREYHNGGKTMDDYYTFTPEEWAEGYKAAQENEAKQALSSALTIFINGEEFFTDGGKV